MRKKKPKEESMENKNLSPKITCFKYAKAHNRRFTKITESEEQDTSYIGEKITSTSPTLRHCGLTRVSNTLKDSRCESNGAIVERVRMISFLRDGTHKRHVSMKEEKFEVYDRWAQIIVKSWGKIHYNSKRNKLSTWSRESTWKTLHDENIGEGIGSEKGDG